MAHARADPALPSAADHFVGVDIEPDRGPARPPTSAAAKTGVEMEALTAVSVACLTVYDMAKAIDRGMEIIDVRGKSGGRSGTWKRK